MHLDATKYAVIENALIFRGLLPIGGIFVLAVLGDTWNSETSRLKVVLVGLSLIAMAGLLVWFGLVAMTPLAGITSNPSVEILKHRLQLALFVVPFVSASIGTNMVSHTITAKLTFEKSKSVWEIISAVVIGILKIVLYLGIAVARVFGLIVKSLKAAFSWLKIKCLAIVARLRKSDREE